MLRKWQTPAAQCTRARGTVQDRRYYLLVTNGPLRPRSGTSADNTRRQVDVAGCVEPRFLGPLHVGRARPVERSHLSLRMSSKRVARLSNGFQEAARKRLRAAVWLTSHSTICAACM